MLPAGFHALLVDIIAALVVCAALVLAGTLLRQLVAQLGKTVVMVTHDAKAAQAADRTLHLEKGRLIEPGVEATS